MEFPFGQQIAVFYYMGNDVFLQGILRSGGGHGCKDVQIVVNCKPKFTILGNGSPVGQRNDTGLPVLFDRLVMCLMAVQSGQKNRNMALCGGVRKIFQHSLDADGAGMKAFMQDCFCAGRNIRVSHAHIRENPKNGRIFGKPYGIRRNRQSFLTRRYNQIGIGKVKP